MKRAAAVLQLTAIVLTSVLASHTVRAQTTPGAIPNPGTYQGSMEIQRQQDQQAQQYRQQTTQPSQQPQSQGSDPGRISGPNSPRPPSCFDRVAQQPELAPLAQKVYLAQPDVHSSALFGIQTVPTASERPLLLKWLAGRRSCFSEMEKILNAGGWSLQAKRAQELSYQITNDMIGDLAEGKLTYGQFNLQRTKNAITVDRTP
jgi:hypothetical protein